MGMEQESEWMVEDMLCEEKERQHLISNYIVQDIAAPAIVINKAPRRIYFDSLREDRQSRRVLLVQSRALCAGHCHEFVVRILKSDIELQEIGVIGTSSVDKLSLDDAVWALDVCGPRAVYGNELGAANKYYGST